MTWLFDGGDLGTFNWDTLVLQWYPALPKTCGQKPSTLLAMVQSPGGPLLVYLKPNFSGAPDQVIVDELKPLFGLPKMGSHRLTLDKVVTKHDKDTDWYSESTGETLCSPIARRASYLMFQARVNDTSSGEVSIAKIVREPMLRTLPAKEWRRRLGDGFIRGLQRVYLFRSMVRASDTCPSNVLITWDTNQPTAFLPLSVDEMVIKRVGETCREITRGDKEVIFPVGISQRGILAQMIADGTPQGEDPQNLPQRIWEVLVRLGVEKEYRWVLGQTIQNINTMIMTTV